MKKRIVLCTLFVVLSAVNPVLSYAPEEPSLMAPPAAGVYWLIAHGFNSMNMNYGKWVANDVLHTNGTTATTIGISLKHFFNAVTREIMANTLLPEANHYLKQGTSETDVSNYIKTLHISTAEQATLSGVAYDTGRAFLTVKDFYLSALQTLQKWQEYEAHKQLASSEKMAMIVSNESPSLFSMDFWSKTIQAIMLDPAMFGMGMLYFYAGFYANKVCQLTGPAIRAIVTNNNEHLWAINADPWTRLIDTTMAYPLTVFLKPYVTSWIAAARSYFDPVNEQSDTEQIYDLAYVTGDKGLFGYYGLKATVALVSVAAGAFWAGIMQLRNPHVHVA